MAVQWNGRVHEAAQVAPAMPDERLNELAVDIVANGLLDPIILLPDGTLIDGRNRVEACKRVKVQPTFEVRDVDPFQFVMSRLQHRDMTPSQRYAIEAQLLAQAGKRKNGRWAHKTINEKSRDSVIFRARSDALVRLGTVLDYRPETIPQIIAGELSIDRAYKSAVMARDSAAQAQAAREREVQTGTEKYIEAVNALLQNVNLTSSLENEHLETQRGVLKLERGLIELLEANQKQRVNLIAALEEQQA